ncbi:MAG TPA: TetR/AcrR family transcriptional regulator [Marmoricola sp.]|nr:TetR/AcrR family transcriptional regulator [Marmoricola sp.]
MTTSELPLKGGRKSRAARREETMQRVVDAAIDLVHERGEMPLRAVAHRLGMTPPALYRYVSSQAELTQRVAWELDRRATERFRAARDSFPDSDPLGQLTAAAVAFRQWALGNKDEFGLVFTNPDADLCTDLEMQAESGLVFTELLVKVHLGHHTPVPSLDELDPRLVEILRNPLIPADLDQLPDRMRGMVWTFMRSWAALYGTVTLEVFGHIDPRVVEQGHLFKAMVLEQCAILGLGDQLERVGDLLDDLLAGP